MREESISSYIGFGTSFRYLQDARMGQPIKGDAHIASNLKRFLASLEKLELTVTATAARQQGLPILLKEFEKASSKALLTKPQAENLKGKIRDVRKTLFAETVGKRAFITTPKRWDVDRLLTDPGALFAADVFDALEGGAAYDFSEACRCLAFECSTAAAFHMMRGTESVLRSFYCHVVRRNRLEERQRMWGPMIKALEARSKPPPKALLDNLDTIRENFRNPTQHPDAIYTSDEAQDLFGLVVPVVNRMVQEIAA
jgi:hypothetical protein